MTEKTRSIRLRVLFSAASLFEGGGSPKARRKESTPSVSGSAADSSLIEGAIFLLPGGFLLLGGNCGLMGSTPNCPLGEQL